MPVLIAGKVGSLTKSPVDASVSAPHGGSAPECQPACLQNNGRLSNRKRKSHFEILSDGEVAALEACVVEGYGV